MNKKAILSYLANQTAFFDPDNPSDIFTASGIANQFVIKRNTASLYLNELVSQKKLIKINTRPVYFLHKTAFENQFFAVDDYQFNSLDELFSHQSFLANQDDIFKSLIGYNQSLKKIIEQLKTAMLYPNGGLPILITGASGTGKSYLAKQLYWYGLNYHLIAADAPFITLNCAQYANNPELLTSNLFGYVKGAFTGANESQSGAFEYANGGILFLDEVHRLNIEGQEKLFTYLDKGVIYRVGDTKNALKLSVRLIFATTENRQTTFLDTFLRRIPVNVELPNLDMRSKQEKQELIYYFFQNEARIVNLKLLISPQTLSCLRDQYFTANIGELENVIKLTVATAFSKQPNQSEIRVTIYDIPAQYLNQLNTKTTHISETDIEIDKSTKLDYLNHDHNQTYEMIYDTYIRLFSIFDKPSQPKFNEQMELRMLNEIDSLFDKLVFENRNRQNQQIISYIMSHVKNELQYLTDSFNIQFNGNYIYAVSYYLYYRASFHYSFNQKSNLIIDSILTQISQRYPLIFRLTKELFLSIDHKIDTHHQPIDIIILSLYLSRVSTIDPTVYTKAIILAHGYATASSIANVVNRLLGTNILESFDMPIDITPNEIANKVMDYIEHHDISKGLMLLVDMGSLKEIYQLFPHSMTYPIAIINNVSTQLALDVAGLIQEQVYLEKIVEQVVTNNMTQHRIIYPQLNKKKAIITTCITGIGTANKMKLLLNESISGALDIDIIAYEFEALETNKQNEAVFSLYDVMAIIGTLNPNISGIPYISLEELISGNGNEHLLSLFSSLADHSTVLAINNQIIKNFSLERVIESVTILDSNKVINHVEQCINQYEYLTQTRLSNDKKVALYIHISCLIERLIRNIPIESHFKESHRQCQKERLEIIKNAFSVMENIYSVKIPEMEHYYIYDILYQPTDLITAEQDF